ncbi:MAG TPA: class I SAM-dependent methyltransferase [Syntrophorhabdaceae bacterium]|nr:class I SAM-dependent methyltransferase [Syntrophorhabdaceae bacterium]HQM81146.1 class I SAM-dependent methyltransferase [Syntrophorhabdaceae bacterium]
MLKTGPFQDHADQYDRWFKENRSVYEVELRTIRSFITDNRRSLEVGVGTGRFAAPLGIRIGIEPAESMRAIALKRKVNVLGAAAEHLPFKDSSFGLVMMITVVCFVNDIDRTFKEAFRVLSKDGSMVVGMMDRSGPLGLRYSERKQDSLFYGQATFYSVDEILEIMKRTGFNNFSFRQSIFGDISKTSGDEAVKAGYGTGSFVAIRGKKREV